MDSNRWITQTSVQIPLLVKVLPSAQSIVLQQKIMECLPVWETFSAIIAVFRLKPQVRMDFVSRNIAFLNSLKRDHLHKLVDLIYQ